MNLEEGFQIEKPPVTVPWGIDEVEFRSMFPDSHRVTAGYYVTECISLGGLTHQLGFHFEPRIEGRLVELEFFRRQYATLQASYDDFQRRLESFFGRPVETAKGSWEESMPTYRWSSGGATITHLVYDRFGPEEHVRITRS